MPRPVPCSRLRALSLTLICAALPAFAGPLTELPLQPGYYVSDGTACADASNATITLVGGKTFNWPQQACTVQAIDPTGPASYAVSMACEATADFPAEVLPVKLEIPNDTQYGLTFETEPPAVSNYCAQADLPEPWRGNDISDLIK